MEKEYSHFHSRTGERRFVVAYNDIIFDKNLSGNDLKIYLYLKSYGGQNDLAFTGLERMKTEMNISIPTIRKSLSNLEENGYLYIKKERKSYGWLNNYYIYDPNNNAKAPAKKKENNNKDVTSKCISLISEKFYNQINPTKLDSMIIEIEKLGANAYEIISLAAEYTLQNNKNLNYFVKIINNWADENITTLEQAKSKVAKPNKNKDVNVSSVLEGM